MNIPDTERLQYALIDESDAELMYELDQDTEVMRYINGGKATTREEIQEVYLPRLAKYSNPEKGWGMWKLTIRENGQFIGWILVRPMDFFSDNPKWDDWELGWRLKRDAWGKGFATEAAKHVMSALAKQPEVKHFSAIAMPGNDASINIMKKLGMTYQKTGIHSDPLGDEEVVYYTLKL